VQIAQVARLFFYTNISKFYLEINLLNYIIFIIIVLFYHYDVECVFIFMIKGRLVVEKYGFMYLLKTL